MKKKNQKRRQFAFVSFQCSRKNPADVVVAVRLAAFDSFHRRRQHRTVRRGSERRKTFTTHNKTDRERVNNK